MHATLHVPLCDAGLIQPAVRGHVPAHALSAEISVPAMSPRGGQTNCSCQKWGAVADHFVLNPPKRCIDSPRDTRQLPCGPTVHASAAPLHGSTLARAVWLSGPLRVCFSPP
eukprot:scaffold24490_cov60-Phaeocystis_antarctica.AAC.3